MLIMFISFIRAKDESVHLLWSYSPKPKDVQPAIKH